MPLDSADAITRKRYRDYAAGRHERTLSPQGERRTLYPRDIVGTAEEILETLFSDPILPEVSELRLELPYEFADEEYRQIIQDFTTLIAPHLGWRRDAAPSAWKRGGDRFRYFVLAYGLDVGVDCFIFSFPAIVPAVARRNLTGGNQLPS